MHSFFQWMDTTSISQYLQQSTLWFPVVEVFHLIGLTIWLGAVFVVSIRLFNLGLQQPAAQTHAGLWGWTWAGLVLVLGTGLILMVAEPIKLATNDAFYWKLYFLAGGIALHLFGYLVIVKPGRAEDHPTIARLCAALTLACWFGAGVAGRAIGFV